MPGSRRSRTAATFAGQAVALASGAWSELGVSGWTSTHGDWAVDPEPLILFTAWLGDADPRLRDEATDWCVRHWRYVSKARLKNLVRTQPADVRAAFGEFAATVGQHAGVEWPAATEPRAFKVTGRSALPPLDRPSLVWVRMRAMFGVGARAEILRCFLTGDMRWASVANLSGLTGYAKRNVADECDTLQRAGLLVVRTLANRFYYTLADRERLESFVGDLPPVRPHWTSLLNVARELVALEGRTATPSTLAVHARKMLDAVEDDLDLLRVAPPRGDVRGAGLWPAVQELGRRTLREWSAGHWARADASPPVRRLVRPQPRSG
jgi:hypothetical protein